MAPEKSLDGSQVQEISCSTFRLEKVIEPTRSWRYWLERMINKTIKDANVFGIFGCIVAKEIKTLKINGSK